jgi:DNA-binding transcriptional LysR family regulator
MATHGGLSVWELQKDGQDVRLRVEGQLVFNDAAMPLHAALDGFGIAFLLEDQVRLRVTEGRLVRVLADWCEPFYGYHLYYPSRRQHSPAFALLIEALRYRGLNSTN